jgi:predicted Zn-dependent protease
MDESVAAGNFCESWSTMMKNKMMTKILSPLLLALVLSNPAWAQSGAQSAQPQDGVKVGEMSRMRNLVPAEQVEGQAAQQYLGLKQQAYQQNALAEPGDPRLQRVQAIAKKLIPYALRWNPRAPQWKWEVVLLRSNQVNAFCMPGGKIAFYTGILDSLKMTDDEIALVMGHEMAHALREHGRERMAKTGAANALSRLAGAGLSAWLGVDPRITNSVTNGAAKLAVLKFSREDETEADVVGLDIAARAGFDPRAGVMLWQKMALVNKGAPPQWLSTHPAGENRIAEIRRHLPEVMPIYAKTRGVEAGELPPYASNVKQLGPVAL